MTEELQRLQRALELKEACMRQLEADADRLRACEQLARDLLDPERLGWAADAEIRDAARRALGIAPVEVKVAMASFNEENARRDALEWPRGSLGEDVPANALADRREASASSDGFDTTETTEKDE